VTEKTIKNHGLISQVLFSKNFFPEEEGTPRDEEASICQLFSWKIQ
jgi:hypothetical protein